MCFERKGGLEDEPHKKQNQRNNVNEVKHTQHKIEVKHTQHIIGTATCF